MKNKNRGEIVEFKCIPEICTYNSKDYKVYGVRINTEKYPNIKLNKYGNVSINGCIHDLGLFIEYTVSAYEEVSKYGVGYKIVNIKRDKPTDLESSRRFLYEILTISQANTLLDAYPDIIDKVMSDKLEDIDLSKTNGIKEYTFNLIKEKIIENFCLVEMVAEFKGLLSISILKKLYDRYPSLTKIRSELKNAPYKCLCGLSRIGFKSADSLILEIDKSSQEAKEKGEKPILDFGYDVKTSIQRSKACVMYLLEEHENTGNTRIDVKELKKQCDKLAPACSHHFVDVVKHDEDIYYDKPTQSVALKNTYLTEVYIAQRMLCGLKENNVWDIDTQKYKVGDDITLTDEQAQSLDYLCKYNIFILNGFAGSGKTASTNAIIKMLIDNDKSFKLFSPTGRASKVLAEYTKQPASTIHRGLGFRPPNNWSYNENDKLYCDVLIIDEFSMVDTFLMEKVLKAIDFRVTKLMLIGDSAQIPSVAAGNLLHDFLNSGLIPNVTLTKIFRYGKGGLATVATKTRLSEKFFDDNVSGVQMYGEDKSYIYLPFHQEKIVGNLKQLYKKLLDQGYAPKDILILSCYNKGEYGTIEINRQIQPIANKMISKKFQYGETMYFVDDLVIQCVNNYESVVYEGYIDDYKEPNTTFISNGEIGKIVEVLDRHIVVDYDGVQILYSMNEMNQLKLAYSISTHKSQGGQAKIVILITPKAHTYMLNSNLIYVGQTRAREKCYHFGEPTTINKAIKKKENFDRMTFMGYLLKS